MTNDEFKNHLVKTEGIPPDVVEYYMNGCTGLFAPFQDRNQIKIISEKNKGADTNDTLNNRLIDFASFTGITPKTPIV